VGVEVGGGEKLPVRVIDVLREGRLGGGYFAYWFMDETHRTAAHWQRLFWMAWNDLFLGVRRPWAYVSLWMNGPHDQQTLDQLLALVRQLYPALVPAPAMP